MGGYDYIIVGGGSAGCVLAGRLSQDPEARVLLLEAGGPADAGAFAGPAAWPGLVGGPADWGDRTVPQADAGPLPYPRGRVLGGSGSINAMAHVRGHRHLYDAWAAGGAHGWGYAGLLPYFLRSERRAGGGPGVRGDDGPIEVGPVPEQARHPVARALADALIAAGQPVTADLSGSWQEGVAWADLAISASGRRASPFTAYVGPVRAGRGNLEIRTGCLVTQLIIRHGRCAGVSYVHDGAGGEARADGVVIVCAGAIGSPALLMRSGIGPADHLRAVGIDPVADLPGVGDNLQDHPVVMAAYWSVVALPGSRGNHGEVYASLRSPLAGAIPDLHLFPILFPVAAPGQQAPPSGFALAAAVMAPDSRGIVRVPSADPGAPPLIDPGLLRDRRDLQRLHAALAMARDAAGDAVFARLGITETAPGTAVRDPAGVRAWIRRTVGSYWHPAGTCRMGDGPGAVTDPQLRVRGITGLRIADASVIPLIPNAPLHATVLAIAEKAADLITRPWHGRPSLTPPRDHHQEGPHVTTGSATRNAQLRRYVETRHIDRIPDAARHGKPWHQFAFWFGGNTNVFNVVLGAVTVAIGLPFWWALAAITIGTAIGALLIALHATQGPRLGVPQTIQSRAQFGFWGASFLFPAVLLLNIGFIAAELVIQAQAMTGVTAALPMPAWIIVLTIPSVVIGIFGYAWIHKVMQATAVIVGATLVIMLIKGLRHALPAAQTTTATPHVGLFAAGVALFTIDMLSFGPFTSDYTRYLPAATSGRRLFCAIYAGCVTATVASAAIGAYLAALLPAVDPVTAIGRTSGTWALLIMAFSLVNANTFNAYTGAFQVLSFTGMWHRFRPESVTARVIPFLAVMAAGAAIAVLGYGHFVANLSNFLDVILVLFIPWSAVNLADYFWVRRGRYDVAAFFDTDGGPYGKAAWRGLTAYAIGLATEWPFVSQPDYTGPLVARLGGADISWLVGWLATAAVYLLLTQADSNSATRRARPAHAERG